MPTERFDNVVLHADIVLLADGQAAVLVAALHWGLTAVDADVACACCEAVSGLASHASLFTHSPSMSADQQHVPP